MTLYFCILAVLCVVVNAAPPSPPRLYQQHAPAHLQNISPLDYFTDNSDVAAYYNQAQQKQGGPERGAPARLESLEPDSEVELIPGAQQPQQPPQQTPVSPNLPGLVPGQRVFIVHMPVAGYRPGSIGGYQPIYIVAAAPQGQTAYAANGYQNAVLVNPAGLGGAPGQVVSPFFGYPAGQAPAGLVFGGQLPYRGFEPVYQQQVDPAYYQAGAAPGPQQPNPQQAIHLSQLVGLQGQAAHPANNPRNAASQSENPKRVGEASESVESKEALREERRNARPGPAHAQSRSKA